jgi:CHAD domain-containing protein
VARAREVPGFNCDESFELAAVRVIEVRADEVFKHAGAVLDLDDIEPVHDMRVATRRLRTALEIFEPCFPRKRFRELLEQVKVLADALGERRDRDVAIESLEGFAAEAAPADRERLATLIEELRDEQRAANVELARLAKAKRLKKLRRRLRKLVQPVETVGQ